MLTLLQKDLITSLMNVFLIMETKSEYTGKTRYCYDTQEHMECICALVLECVHVFLAQGVIEVGSTVQLWTDPTA